MELGSISVNSGAIKSLANNLIVPVILGPTACGKTEVSILLSEYFPSEIITADSRQVFKYLDIGTAKPTPDEMKAAKRHFVDFLEPDEYYSAGSFGDDAEKKALEIFAQNKIPIVEGGSGLYIKSMFEGLFDEPNTGNNSKIRESLEKKLQEKGAEALYRDLKKVDSESAEKYPDRNPRRLIRALEYFYASGEKLSESQEKNAKKRSISPLYFGIEMDRAKLYSRINERAEKMWENGLKQELKRVLDMGFARNLNSLNTVGYKERLAFLDGHLSEEEALAKMQQNTRRYAKRQLTWFRKIDGVKWFSGAGIEIAKKIAQYINSYF